MLTYALIVFAIAAVGGMVLATSVLRGRLAPWAISIAHALLGATGLALLVVALMQGALPSLASIALAVLALAALGGFYLASIHARGKLAPKVVVFVHAGAAVTGFLVLLCAVLAR